MTIALACSGLGNVRRGNETWARTVCEALHTAGEPVHLFGGGHLPDARCPYTQVWNLSRDWFGWRKLLPWGRRYAYEQQTFAWALTRQLRGNRFEIIHTADPVLAYRLGRIARHNGCQLIYKDGLLLGPAWCQRFDWVQVLAPHYRDDAFTSGVATDRWFVIPHIVDCERFCPSADKTRLRREVLQTEIPAEDLVIFGCGDFSPQSHKRLEWLIDEVASLGPGSRMHLVLAGQATSQDVRLMEARCRCLGDRIHLRPNTPGEQMSELYQVADVFAHAALREPFGIVFIEAMATGIPVIGHQFPVSAWIVGDGGAMVDMTAKGTLAQTLVRWQKEPNLLRELGAAARDRATSTFTADRIVPLYRQLYAELRSA